MHLMNLLAIIPLIFSVPAVAQSSPSVVCVAGQCLQGFTNISMGATLSMPGTSTSIQLLPGQYTADTNPQLLHTYLTSSSASLSSSVGFNNSTTVSLPLNIALQPGLVAYSKANYSGDATFTALPETNGSLSSTTTSIGSVLLSSNVWAAVSSSSSPNGRLILWDSIPDMARLPSSALPSALSILDIQSAACSPPCSGSGICSASGTCTCPAGFTGSSCESCAAGFFGPNCLPCPAGCTSCDEGITGSGRCLTAPVLNPPASCNCLNGVCGANGQCQCNAGWTTADNGTACAKCAQGFFLTSDGNCQACQLGCAQCADNSGDCISCKSGFTQDSNDRTKCFVPPSTTSTGVQCPDGTFSNGSACTQCSPICKTCTGPTSNECIICSSGRYSLNGNCVLADGNGVCEGTAMIADNNKVECDSCPAKCTACKIPSFSIASTVNLLQCTGCLPGFVLSEGKCVESCPSGTFLDPKDNLTCTACDSSCTSCAGSATFCLSCANNQLASAGKCVASCPSNTFSSSGTCIPCHPDCASCSGASFNQCSSCPANRPVLTNGRCLPTCSKSQYFDKTSSSCQSCDSSCSSCSGSGPNNCLACSNSDQVLHGGTCVSSTCASSTKVVPELGLCLSDLVSVPVSSGTSTSLPFPTVTGLDTPITPSKSGIRLQWWEILLMALGCAFIFLVVLMLWRRHARKRRAKATAKFAVAKNLDQKPNWRYRLIRFGERLFGHRPMKQIYVASPADRQSVRMEKFRDAEEARHENDMDKILDGYNYSRYSRASPSRQPSPLPSLHDYSHNYACPQRMSATSLSAGSIYSQITGIPRKGADPRQPVRNARDLLPSRFSGSSYSTSARPDPLPPPPVDLLDTSRPPTPAQEYARLVQGQVPPGGSYWLQPTQTGNSTGSRNPFRR